MINFTCDLLQKSTPFDHIWEHTVGSGHAALALRADYQAQLRKSRQDLGFEHVRFHAILSDPMDTLICEENKFLYSFFNADQILDYLLSIGMRPFVELSFMPDTLSSGDMTVFHYRANVTPPKDYNQWGDLIHRLVGHWVDRYGLNEASQWFFEVWNEPNLEAFWTGSQEDYFNLYRYTAEAIKNIDPSLKVGGPATAQNAWIPEMLDFCQKNDLPIDFISTHYYPTDAFGQVGDDTETQLEHAPRDIMHQKAQEARNQVGDRPLYYTEWNISSNPRDPFHDQPFAAAYAVHVLMNIQSLVQGYSFWTFSDIFSENYFPSVPFQGGFGLLNIQCIPKPVYRAFELLHRLGTEMLCIEGTHETVEAWAIRRDYSVTLLLTNHAQPRHPIKTERVHFELGNAPEPLSAYIERIDEYHANPRKTWIEMGQPEYLSFFEVEQLQAVSHMEKEPIACGYSDNRISLDIDLPPHAVAAITLEMPSQFAVEPKVAEEVEDQSNQ